MKLKSFEHTVNRTFGGRPFRRALFPDGGFWIINNVEVVIVRFLDDQTFWIIPNDAEDDDEASISFGPFDVADAAAVAATLLSSN